jgi:hypothetical protein
MEALWRNLPIELSEKICNNLIRVRAIPPELKHEIECGKLYVLHDQFMGFLGSSNMAWGVIFGLLNYKTNTELDYIHYSYEGFCTSLWKSFSNELKEDLMEILNHPFKYIESIMRNDDGTCTISFREENLGMINAEI